MMRTALMSASCWSEGVFKSPHHTACFLAAASAALLIGAITMQFGFGVQPCELCLWQRIPHLVVLLFAGGVVLAKPRQPWLWVAMCGGILLIGGAIAVFHVGVEQHWWSGTPRCGVPDTTPASLEELEQMIMKQPIIRCDNVSWSLFGVSLAGYNAVLSLSLALSTFGAAWRGQKKQKRQ
ncbi:protein dithiol:quinone oxidoreductase [Azospirillaceae bacterium]